MTCIESKDLDGDDNDFPLTLSTGHQLPSRLGIMKIKELDSNGKHIDVDDRFYIDIDECCLEDGGEGTAADAVMDRAGRISDIHNTMVQHFQEEHIGEGPVGDCFIKLTGGSRRDKTGHAKARPAEPNSYSVNNDDEPPSISSPHVDIDRSSDDESNDKYVEGHPTEHTTRGCGSGAGESLPSQPVPKEQIKNIEGCSTEQTSETSDCQVSVLNKDAASEDLCSTPLLQHSEPCPSSSDKQPYNVSNDHLYTSAELDKLNQISMECQKLFPVDGKIIYDNPKVLKKQLQDSIGDKYGFVVALISSRIECLNANAPKHSKKRTEKRHAVIPPTSRRARKTTRCGCPFSIKFTPLNYKDRRDDKRVVITKANYEHTNGCRPSSMQLVQQHVQSGTFSCRGSPSC